MAFVWEKRPSPSKERVRSYLDQASCQRERGGKEKWCNWSDFRKSNPFPSSQWLPIPTDLFAIRLAQIPSIYELYPVQKRWSSKVWGLERIGRELPIWILKKDRLNQCPMRLYVLFSPTVFSDIRKILEMLYSSFFFFYILTSFSMFIW